MLFEEVDVETLPLNNEQKQVVVLVQSLSQNLKVGTFVKSFKRWEVDEVYENVINVLTNNLKCGAVVVFKVCLDSAPQMKVVMAGPSSTYCQ